MSEILRATISNGVDKVITLENGKDGIEKIELHESNKDVCEKVKVLVYWGDGNVTQYFQPYIISVEDEQRPEEEFEYIGL